MKTLLGAARGAARAIVEAYVGYRAAFQRVTVRARWHFEAADRAAAQRDAIRRLDLYRDALDDVLAVLQDELGEQLHEAVVWRVMRSLYSEEIRSFPDVELAETFFNSVTRKIFDTVGLNPVIEFVDLDARRYRYGFGALVHRTFPRGSTTAELVRAILSAYAFSVPFRDAEEDARLAAEVIDERWGAAGHGEAIEAIDVLESVFYRGGGAYLVGRIRGGDATGPLVLALLMRGGKVEVDAVLCTERDVSIVFSYTRSHFLVETERPSGVTGFLSTILPRKRVAELYIGLGYPKHGKTELYRDLIGHLGRSMDRFGRARGIEGLVMLVFTLPSFDYVFKVIRDEFAPPKTTSREDVLSRYRLVFRHDRAGRLIEAQEFEHLVFDRRRFQPGLLEELATAAAETVIVTGNEVHIRHLYVERRVEPLDLFLRSARDEEADRVVREYGRAIRDLATTNIFPGDLLLKNFGVTRHGRVTFYDYDELCLVTDCVFRHMPVPRDGDEELAAEPWFYVGENDVFPEEFLHFMGFDAHQRRVFLEEHADILTAGFWLGLQARLRAGEVLDLYPYPPSRRLRGPRSPDPR